MYYLWFQFLLGLSAFLDFASVMAQSVEQQQWTRVDEVGDDNIRGSSHYFSWPWKCTIWCQQDRWIHVTIGWLRCQQNFLALWFACLWFGGSFLAAHRQRERRIQIEKLEKVRLSRDTKGRERIGGEAFPTNKQSTSMCTSKYVCAKAQDWLQSAQGVYMTTILVQLLLLPVGFYVFLYSRLSHYLGFQDSHVEVHNNNDSCDDSSYNMHANLALGFVLIKRILLFSTQLIHRSVRSQFRQTRRRLARRVVWTALRNPFHFHRRVQSLLRIVRWIQYCAPLIGTSNKLLENVSDYMKRQRQRRAARIALLLRRKQMHTQSKEYLDDFCARLVQKVVRGHLHRKKTKALKLLQGQKKTIMALRLQHWLRKYLARIRKRLSDKQKELEYLQMGALDQNGVFRLQELSDELHRETSDWINRKLLLRPNTFFAVTWRLIFVCVVLLEVTQLAIKPRIEKRFGKDANLLEHFITNNLTPTPLHLRKACIPPRIKRGPWAVLGALLPGIRAPSREKIRLPWYCESTVVAFLLNGYAALLNRLSDYTMNIVAIIVFSDVFISFFIGEYDEQTGILVPKPFFKRWILPGIALQLLVNPQLESMCDALYVYALGLWRRGPFRVARWTIALFYPVCVWIKLLIRRKWMQLVGRENQWLLKREFSHRYR